MGGEKYGKDEKFMIQLRSMSLVLEHHKERTDALLMAPQSSETLCIALMWVGDSCLTAVWKAQGITDKVLKF